MSAPKKYWIKERDNPQLGTYFVPCGQMSKTAAAKAENTKYGCNTMHAYETEAAKWQALAAELADPLDAASCSGGFCWCDMCGYVATLTEPMLKEWDEDDADPQACYRICQLCEDSGMDSHLRHGRKLPDHIAEDDPMPQYSQNAEVCRPARHITTRSGKTNNET